MEPSNQYLFERLIKETPAPDPKIVDDIQDAAGKFYDLLARKGLVPAVKQKGRRGRTRGILPILAFHWHEQGMKHWKIGAALKAYEGGKPEEASNEIQKIDKADPNYTSQKVVLCKFADRYIRIGKELKADYYALLPSLSKSKLIKTPDGKKILKIEMSHGKGKGNVEELYSWYWSAKLMRLRFKDAITQAVLEYLQNEKRQQEMDSQRVYSDKNFGVIMSMRAIQVFNDLWKLGPDAVGLSKERPLRGRSLGKSSIDAKQKRRSL